MSKEIIYKEDTFKIIGACFEVYNEKGHCYREPVYQECLVIEFAIQEVPAIGQPKVLMAYK